MSPAISPICPQCGEKSAKDFSQCSACGAELSVRRTPTSQPVFELRVLALNPEGLNPVDRGARRVSLWRRARVTLEAAGETAAAIALRPEASFRAFRLDGGMAAPIGYSILLGGPSLLIGLGARAILSPEGDEISRPEALALLALLPPVYVYLRAQAIHLVLVLRGDAREPFLATFRLAAYANASVAPLLVVPYAGLFLFLAAGAAVEATGLRFGHRMNVSSAVLAELIPALVLLIGLAAGLLTRLLWWSQTRG